MKKMVLFGAGKIGRSFIAQLFSKGGYEVVFVDIDPSIIDALNQNGEYTVVVKSNEGDADVKIQNVRGVLATEHQQVVSELVSADICSVSVGKKGLPHVIPVLAESLKVRYQQRPDYPLDVILAENMRNAAEYVRRHLQEYLSSAYELEEMVGLIETSIGKMVPIMPKEASAQDILNVYAEPYNTLILDKKGFKNPIPDIEGLAPKDNIKAWVDRKLFIHNLGHAVVAYRGYVLYPQSTYIYELLEDQRLKEEVRATMLESANILCEMYPGEFTQQDLIAHIDDLLSRFENKALGDTVYRVGCDLPRKLGPEDRLAGAIKNGIKKQMPIDKILYALVCGFHFRATDEEGNMHPNDRILANEFYKGIPYLMETYSGFDSIKDQEIINKALAFNEQIRSAFAG